MRHEHELVADQLLNIIREHSIKSVCDYGCADGAVLELLYQKAPSDVFFTGFDFFHDQNQMTKKNKDRLTFVDRKSEDFNMIRNEQNYDLVILMHTVSHFNTPVTEMKNVLKFLKSGSYIYIVEIAYDKKTPSEIASYFGVFLEELHQELSDDYLTRHYTKEQLVDLLALEDLDLVFCDTETYEAPKDETDKVTESLIKVYQDWHDSYNDANEVKKSFMSQMFKIEIELLKKYSYSASSRTKLLYKKK